MTCCVVGIDPSLTATGVCTDTECTTVPGRLGDPYRLTGIHRGVRRALLHADLAVIEDLPKRAFGAGLTGMAQGVIRMACELAMVDYALIPAATLKKFATGNGAATKAQMTETLQAVHGVTCGDDNQVDAWWLRWAGLAWTGQVAWRDDRTDLLEKGKWPVERRAYRAPAP